MQNSFPQTSKNYVQKQAAQMVKKQRTPRSGHSIAELQSRSRRLGLETYPTPRLRRIFQCLGLEAERLGFRLGLGY